MGKLCAKIGRKNRHHGVSSKNVIFEDDFFPMYKGCKDSKDQGGFHDFVEILKLYDKNGDDTIIGNQLFRLLTTLGEKLTKEEAKSLMKELCEPEDDDGFMAFKPFLERMCAAEK
jgi:Ca2+-binding EF-hand superfamily protein